MYPCTRLSWRRLRQSDATTMQPKRTAVDRVKYNTASLTNTPQTPPTMKTKRTKRTTTKLLHQGTQHTMAPHSCQGKGRTAGHTRTLHRMEFQDRTGTQHRMGLHRGMHHQNRTYQILCLRRQTYNILL